ncbi:dihydrofolate reductase family protein [Thermomonospora cellulosilytica]|uniref:Dihydrofolate reductase n=1 Tax=Thermomonospora cellulosilytica TaxID=1411118 RepID=A0A7W3N1I5_9ACTN|nr:dihydrofolate reductase family protein [Thermomonospora cellulosilytica]MBA9005779.1 dihydrofolate reductase [Thermomonospora cellulosilytica]
MSRLVVNTFVTLDGVMQAPGGPEEDRSGGFEHGGWIAPHFDDTAGAFINEVIERAGSFLLGRRTYEIFAGYWPHVTDEDDVVASRLNTLPKYVASRTLDKADWHNTTVIRDVPAEVAALKEQPGGELQVHGSGNLVQTLIEHDLVDAYNLLTFPVVLGTGKRLFPEGTTPGALRLTHTQTTGTGVVITSYERAGKPTYGTVGQDT